MRGASSGEMFWAMTRWGESRPSRRTSPSRSLTLGDVPDPAPKSSSTIGRISGRWGANHAHVDLAAVDELLGERLVVELLADLAHPLGQLVPVLAPRECWPMPIDASLRAGLTISGKVMRPNASKASPSKVSEVGRVDLVVLEQLLGEDLVLRQQQPGRAEPVNCTGPSPSGRRRSPRGGSRRRRSRRR